MTRAAMLCLLALYAAGCTRDRGLRCALGEAELIAKSDVSGYDDIALVQARDGAHAAWSNKLGLFTRPLQKGARTEQLARSPCRGGVAALPGAELSIACARPEGDGEHGGTLWLYSGAKPPRALAKLGRDAHGVAMAGDTKETYVAYADGAVGGPRVSLVALGTTHAPVALSEPAQNGREPAMLIVDGAPVVVFAASELGPKGPRHQLLISRAGAPGRLLLALTSESPMPALARDGDSIVLAFRDRPRPKARSELYTARLNAKTLALSQKPRAIGRANGQTGPSLAFCERTRAVVLPIDHAGELFIAFNPLSHELATPEANHQYYENEHEFVQSRAICVNGYPLTLIGERTEANQPAARLLTAEFRCQQ